MTWVHRRAADLVRSTRASVDRDLVQHRSEPRVDPDAAEAAHASLAAGAVRTALVGLSTVQRQALDGELA